ncbi:hypothetical protein [Phenylobacterium aquaticum]|uniref:hypothetical protein n=1 Tax=Phenylobacterium aquaticum TaxID=1763816 RepID=UPI001F5D847C|nr:hypothetical protein [Phenylobacterium aquaticum]MCI3133155.1 hypothetical protein [Phenylobacterium aquaticum]
MGFLMGDWGGQGQVADTGGTSSGRSSFTPEVGGTVLLRRDHTDLLDAVGKSQGGFDQLMWIYSERGAVRADYADGQHIIHYDRATVSPGRAVTFFSVAQAGAPTFRLAYTLAGPDVLRVSFGMAAPGQSDFHDIAQGELRRAAH